MHVYLTGDVSLGSADGASEIFNHILVGIEQDSLSNWNTDGYWECSETGNYTLVSNITWHFTGTTIASCRTQLLLQAEKDAVTRYLSYGVGESGPVIDEGISGHRGYTVTFSGRIEEGEKVLPIFYKNNLGGTTSQTFVLDGGTTISSRGLSFFAVVRIS
jgi:hypothetical protein